MWEFFFSSLYFIVFYLFIELAKMGFDRKRVQWRAHKKKKIVDFKDSQFIEQQILTGNTLFYFFHCIVNNV